MGKIIFIAGEIFLRKKLMNGIGYISTLQIQTHSTRKENRSWERYDASIASAASGGLFFVLLGFLLLAVFTLSDRSNAALDYLGVGSLIAGFMFFGFAAHFMDKRDDCERQFKKSRIGRFQKNNF